MCTDSVRIPYGLCSVRIPYGLQTTNPYGSVRMKSVPIRTDSHGSVRIRAEFVRNPYASELAQICTDSVRHGNNREIQSVRNTFFSARIRTEQNCTSYGIPPYRFVRISYDSDPYGIRTESVHITSVRIRTNPYESVRIPYGIRTDSVPKYKVDIGTESVRIGTELHSTRKCTIVFDSRTTGQKSYQYITVYIRFANLLL